MAPSARSNSVGSSARARSNARSPSQQGGGSEYSASASSDEETTHSRSSKGRGLKSVKRTKAEAAGYEEWEERPPPKRRSTSQKRTPLGPKSKRSTEPAALPPAAGSDGASMSSVPSSPDPRSPALPALDHQLSTHQHAILSPELGESAPLAVPVKMELDEVVESELTSLASSSASPEAERKPMRRRTSAKALVNGVTEEQRKMFAHVDEVDMDESDYVPPPKKVGAGKGAKRAPQVATGPRRIRWSADKAYTVHPGPVLAPQEGLTYAIQNTLCFHPALKMYPQCHMCVARQGGNICLFRGARSFPVDPTRDPTKPIVPTGPPAFLNSVIEDEPPDFPNQFNEPLTIEHVDQIKTAAAPALIPTLERELGHASHPDARRIKLPLADRSECDTCLHAMFGGKFQCSLCGREQCFDCHQKLISLERAAEASGGPSLFEQVSQAEVDIELRRLLLCSGRGGECPVHTSASFVRLTRFHKEELERWTTDMQTWAAEHPPPPKPTVSDATEAKYYARGAPVDDNQSFLNVPLVDFTPAQQPSTQPSALGFSFSAEPAWSAPQPPSAESIAAAAHLFHSLWVKGETMLVNIDAADANYKQWTPEKFAEKVMDVRCIVGCNRTGQQYESTVGRFFARFGRNDTSEGHSMKIMDWPSTSDFQLVFPELFSDYMNSIPFGSVTRRDGVLNVAAHHPTNANPPDLGPKGYFSEISDDGPGGNGSTKLHMDVADAVNLMFWAGPTVNGEPGFAAWDLFRAEDADKIREFLYKLHAKQKQLTLEEAKAAHDDPIHTQVFFLDSELRQQLADEYNVKPWRIYQRPGEVVFIPAGCAHQVCNFADCIKIASDFVSLENVNRCWKLTDEFRQQTKDNKLWRTDVLQLKSQLLWAWRSCERFDNHKTAPLTADNLAASSAPSPPSSEDTASLAPSPSQKSATDLHPAPAQAEVGEHSWSTPAPQVERSEIAPRPGSSPAVLNGQHA